MEEINAAIKEHTEQPQLQTKILSLRPTYAIMQSATISVPKEVASKLINAGELRLGINNCKISENIRTPKCFKCWEMGHTAVQCLGTDRSKLCRKCAKEKDNAKNCVNAEYCMECGIDGHRPCTMACPKYRRRLFRRQESNATRDKPQKEVRTGETTEDMDEDPPSQLNIQISTSECP